MAGQSKSTEAPSEPAPNIAPYVAKLRAVVPDLPPSQQLQEAIGRLSIRLGITFDEGTTFAIPSTV